MRILPTDLQWTSSGWREVLVDIDPEKSSQKLLRFVLAPGPTPASEGYAALLPPSAEGGHGEVCPEGLVIVRELAARVRAHGGAALVADYGDVAIRRHTLRVSVHVEEIVLGASSHHPVSSECYHFRDISPQGFKQHHLHDVLVDPGTADLTADVDFGAFKRAVSSEGTFVIRLCLGSNYFCMFSQQVLAVLDPSPRMSSYTKWASDRELM